MAVLQRLGMKQMAGDQQVWIQYTNIHQWLDKTVKWSTTRKNRMRARNKDTELW